MSEKKLYVHVPHPHIPVNVASLLKTEQEVAGFNQRLAVLITRSVSNMWCAYIFMLLATRMLIHLLEKNGISLQQLEAEGATTSHLDPFVLPPAAAATPATPTPIESEKQNA